MSKQYEIQREIFTEEDQDADIPKEISSEQNILHSNNQIGNFFLRGVIYWGFEIIIYDL